MDLKIISIHEQGDASKEYVLLEATTDCNLEFFAVADTTYISETKISNKLRHFYWFPKKAIKSGERVILRTGIGTNNDYVTSDGYKVYRFFWGLKSAVWNNTGDGAVLFEMQRWKTTKT